MNKTKKLVHSLESNYNLSIEELLTHYGNKDSISTIAEKMNTTDYVITKVLQHLQLKRPKHKRDLCLKEHRAMMEDDTIDEFTSKIEEENEFLVDKIKDLSDKLNKSRTENNLYRKALRTDSKISLAHDRMLEKFEEALSNKVFTKVKPTFTVAPRPAELPEDGLVVMFSDTHFGEVVKENINNYNYKIALERLDKHIDKIITYPRQSKNIAVAQLGDTIRGMIHGGTYQSEDSLIDSIDKAVDFLVYKYQVLSEVYDNVNVYSITGNHDRVTDNPAIHDKHLDFTRLIDKMVAKQLQAAGVDNVHIYVTSSPYHLVNINSAEVLMMHGDTIRSYNAGVANQRALLQDLCLGTFGKPYKHALSGHTHQFIAAHNQYGGMNITNGTMVGSNTYGIANGMRNILATQTLVFIESDGNIEDVKAILL